jgi:hypothetical protein
MVRALFCSYGLKIGAFVISFFYWQDVGTRITSCPMWLNVRIEYLSTSLSRFYDLCAFFILNIADRGVSAFKSCCRNLCGEFWCRCRFILCNVTLRDPLAIWFVASCLFVTRCGRAMATDQRLLAELGASHSLLTRSVSSSAGPCVQFNPFNRSRSKNSQ